MQMNITDIIWNLREKYRVDPSHIGFEIRESAYENMSSVFNENLKKLSAQGYSIVLGELGTLTPSITSRGAVTIKDFTTDYIQRLDANFIPGDALRGLRDEAQFEQTTTRAAQAAALEAQKDGQTTADWTPEPEEGEGNDEP
jgi:hypothetical protein